VIRALAVLVAASLVAPTPAFAAVVVARVAPSISASVPAALPSIGSLGPLVTVPGAPSIMPRIVAAAPLAVAAPHAAMPLVAAAASLTPRSAEPQKVLNAVFDGPSPLSAPADSISEGASGLPVAAAASPADSTPSPTVASALQPRSKAGSVRRAVFAAGTRLTAAAVPFAVLLPGFTLLASPVPWLTVSSFLAVAPLRRAAKSVLREFFPDLPRSGISAAGSFGALALGGLTAAVAVLLAAWSPLAGAIVVSAAAAASSFEALAPLKRLLTRRSRPRGFLGASMRDDTAEARLAPEDFGRLFMLSGTLEKGLGEKHLYPQLSWGLEKLVYFRRSGDRVELVSRNVAVRAAPGSPMAAAVASSAHGDTVIGSARITEEETETGAVSIALSELIAHDQFSLGEELTRSYGANYEVENDATRVVAAKSFEKNAELSLRMSFDRDGASEWDRPHTHLPDLRKVELAVRLSFSALPEPGFEIRRADARVGYFAHTHQDLTNPTGEIDSTIITRWRLEKKDPTLEKSPVQKPIVYWLDASIPAEFKGAVTEGILEWNKAFEHAGLLGAVEVKDAPTDGSFDPADVRFNVVSWHVDQDAGYAIGPSRSDPRTGEIYNAGIAISAAHFLNAWGNKFKDLEDKDFEANPEERAHGHRHSGGRCSYAEEAARQAGLTLSAFSARGKVLTAEERRKFAEQYIKGLVIHEAGHTLGLRHNFAAKTWRTLEEIAGGAFPMTASMMDYEAVNVAHPDEEQGPLFNAAIGPYDSFAIQYGYTPLPGRDSSQREAALKQFVDMNWKQPGLEYATDEDLAGDDPRTQTWQLGPDAVAFARKRYDVAQSIWKWLEGDVPQAETYRGFIDAWRAYSAATRRLTTVVGGVHRRRGAPIEPVPAAQQREALTLMQKELFSDIPFQASTALRARLVSPQTPTIANPFPEPFEIPYEDMIVWLRELAVERLLDPQALIRIAANGRLEGENFKGPRRKGIQHPLTVPELLTKLDQYIWTEVVASHAKKRKISATRRMVQEFYLTVLSKMAYADDESEVYPEISAVIRAHVQDFVEKLTAEINRKGAEGEWEPESMTHLKQQLTKYKNLAWKQYKEE
jgi:hypothetical protein